MEETFSYNDGVYKANITCITANVLTGLKREMMIAEAYEESKDIDKDVDFKDVDKSAIRIAKLSLYPACKAGSSSIDIKVKAKKSANSEKPEWKTVILTFEKFITLPEALTSKWLATVFRLNPHWSPGYEEADTKEAKEKKA